MSEAEENDEGEPGYFDPGPDPEPEEPKKHKKLPARADRDVRLKVKRSDLDKLMSMKSIPNPKKDELIKAHEAAEEAQKKETGSQESRNEKASCQKG